MKIEEMLEELKKVEKEHTELAGSLSLYSMTVKDGKRLMELKEKRDKLRDMLCQKVMF